MIRTFIVLSSFAALTACGGGGDGATQAAVTQKSSEPQPSLKVVAVEPNPVLQRGAPGSFDSDDVLNPDVVKFNGQLFNFYSGWDGSVWRNGVATSSDGLTWTKGAPVLAPNTGGWSTQYIAANSGSVVFNGKILTYFHGQTPNSIAIGLAESADGSTFTQHPTPVIEGVAGQFDAGAAADPYVIQVGSQLFMYYLGDDGKGKQTIGLARSSDGVNWTRDGASLMPLGGPGSFDERAHGEPAVTYAAPFYYMVFVGMDAQQNRSLGWASSLDGVHWTKQSTAPLFTDAMKQPWFSKLMCDPTILPTGKDDGTFYVWFGGGDVVAGSENLHGQIGRFTIKLN